MEMSKAEKSNKNHKKKKKSGEQVKVLSWRQKKELADMEEITIGKQLDELVSWTSMIESMNDEQLREYILKRPDSLKSVEIGKHTAGKKAQTRRSGKPRSSSSSSSSSSQGLMAAVWKFHKEDDEETPVAQA